MGIVSALFLLFIFIFSFVICAICFAIETTIIIHNGGKSGELIFCYDIARQFARVRGNGGKKIKFGRLFPTVKWDLCGVEVGGFGGLRRDPPRLWWRAVEAGNRIGKS